jgi:predicted regulator of Ras-like GTPase activity (Roadblock/LC7/MglB family)
MISTELVQGALHTLRDVEGVRGSFALNEAGQLLAQDLPATFDTALFAVVGPRVVRFYDALAAQGDAVQQIVMRFTRHELQIRPGRGAFLCVLCESDTNAAALNMAMALAARRLEPTLTALNDESAPMRATAAASNDAPATTFRPASAPECEPTTLPSAATPARAAITYRGRRLG